MSTTPSASASRPAEHATAAASYWRVRRAPRYTRFAALGGGVGLVVALVVAALVHGGSATAVDIGGVARTYSLAQVMGYLGTFGLAVGAGLGLVVAFAFERRARVAKRRRP